MQVDNYISAIVDSNLTCQYNKNTVGYAVDMDGAIDTAGDNKTLFDILEDKAGKWCSISSRKGHVHNAAAQVS